MAAAGTARQLITRQQSPLPAKNVTLNPGCIERQKRHQYTEQADRQVCGSGNCRGVARLGARSCIIRRGLAGGALQSWVGAEHGSGHAGNAEGCCCSTGALAKALLACHACTMALACTISSVNMPCLTAKGLQNGFYAQSPIGMLSWGCLSLGCITTTAMLTSYEGRNGIRGRWHWC